MSPPNWPRIGAALVATITLVAADAATAQELPAAVTYPAADGGAIRAELYGEGSHAVLLAHGRVFNKESWEPLARQLETAGHLVLAIDFRGYGNSTAGSSGNGALPLDVLGGIRYLHEEQHAVAVSVIGGSMGGGAAAYAATRADAGQIEALVLLSAGSVDDPARLQAARILFIASEGDGLLVGGSCLGIAIATVERDQELVRQGRVEVLADAQLSLQGTRCSQLRMHGYEPRNGSAAGRSATDSEPRHAGRSGR